MKYLRVLSHRFLQNLFIDISRNVSTFLSRISAKNLLEKSISSDSFLSCSTISYRILSYKVFIKLFQKFLEQIFRNFSRGSIWSFRGIQQISFEPVLSVPSLQKILDGTSYSLKPCSVINIQISRNNPNIQDPL